MEIWSAVFVGLFAHAAPRRVHSSPATNASSGLTASLDIPVFRVGEGGGYDARVTATGSVETRLDVAAGFESGPLTLPVTGKFNTANALMALAVTHHVAGRLGAHPLGGYTGIRRRQDTLYRSEKLTVLADYAHHPTEIAALLGWLRDTSLARLVVVFQPHRHSRTRQYVREFATAVGVADVALLLPVYSAGEAPVEGGSSREIWLLEPRASLLSGYDELRDRLAAELAGGRETVLAFVGAGDIDRMGARFVRGLFERDHLSAPGSASPISAARVLGLLLCARGRRDFGTRAARAVHDAARRRSGSLVRRAGGHRRPAHAAAAPPPCATRRFSRSDGARKPARPDEGFLVSSSGFRTPHRSRYGIAW